MPSNFNTIKYSLSRVNIIDFNKNFFTGINRKFTFVMPDDLRVIDANTFKDTSIIETIIINEGCVNLCQKAFFNCRNLKSVYLPKSLSYFDSSCFYDCGLLENLYYGSNLDGWLTKHFYFEGLTISNLYLKNDADEYEKVENVIIPDNITSIPQGAFKGCKGIKSVVLNDNITTIGFDAFAWCESLEAIDLPNNLCDIGVQAFLQTGIKHITIPKKVDKIKNGVFQNCESLEEVIFHDDITHIDSNAFAGCSSLVLDELPKNLITVDDFAFFGVAGINALTIPNKVESIGKHCFDGSKINKIIINSVISIEQATFENCRELEVVVLPNNLEYIGNDAFLSCDKLQNIYYYGTQEQWNQIDIADSSFDYLKIYYYSETNPNINGRYWHYVDNEPVIW